MASVCVDASLALSWLLGGESSQQADLLMRKWARDDIKLIAPSMFPAEVTSVLRRAVYQKRISKDEGESLFTVWAELPVSIVQSRQVYSRAWKLAKVYNLPVCYDMQYLAVAELEDCELWTLDRRLVNVTNGNTHVQWGGA